MVLTYPYIPHPSPAPKFALAILSPVWRHCEYTYYYKIYCRYVLKTCNLTHAISINSDADGYRKIATSKTKPVKQFNKKGLIIPNRRTIEYFKNLNKTLIQDLLKLYDPDFKMFQYSEEEFV